MTSVTAKIRAMHLRQALPSPPLAEWIHSFRHYAFQPEDSDRIPCLPGTGAELWFVEDGSLTCHGIRLGDGLFCPRTRRLEFRQAALRVFAIRFRAGALPAFTRRPLDDLIDTYAAPDHLWNDDVSPAVDAIRRTPWFDEKCLLAERLLLQRLRVDVRLDAAKRLATTIFEYSDGFVLRDQAAALHCDRGRLSRQFREIQGIGTKHYHRLCRFERFLRDALFAHRPALAQLAVDHGYCDQSHMQNEVHGISQQSPRALIADRNLRLFYAPGRTTG